MLIRTGEVNEYGDRDARSNCDRTEEEEAFRDQISTRAKHCDAPVKCGGNVRRSCKDGESLDEMISD